MTRFENGNVCNLGAGLGRVFKPRLEYPSMETKAHVHSGSPR